MTIQTFNTSNLKVLRTDIDAALAEVAKKHGISLSLGKMTYGSGNFTAKVEGKSSVGDEQEKALFESYAKTYGLQTDIVSFDGFRLVGFDAKRRAKPWLIRKDGDPADRTYVIDQQGAKLRFAAKLDA